MKQGWEIKKVGEVFDLQMGKTPNRDNRSYWGGNNIWLSISDIKDKYIGLSKDTITDLALKESNIKKVKSGTVIMSFKLTVGRTAITTTDLYTNEAIMAFIPKEDYNILPEYTYYYLSHYKWENSNKAVMGITLNKKVISDSYFEFPERAEQERIVGELDCLSGIIAAKRAQLRELDTLAQSIFYTMFGDPITNDKGWQTKALGDVARIINGYAFDSKLFSTDKNDMPLIRIRDIKKGYTETFYKGKYPNTYIIKNGDYIIGMDGEFNIVEWRGGTALLNQRVCKIEFIDDEVIGRYALRFLSIELKRIEDATSFVTVKHLSSKSLISIFIPIPPIDLQKQFAEKIENIERQKELITKSIKETEDLFNSRMSYYFE